MESAILRAKSGARSSRLSLLERGNAGTPKGRFAHLASRRRLHADPGGRSLYRSYLSLPTIDEHILETQMQRSVLIAKCLHWVDSRHLLRSKNPRRPCLREAPSTLAIEAASRF